MNIPDFSTSATIVNAANSATSAAAKASQRISTTLKVNTAADDPAGIAKATVLNAQISSYASAQSNITNGVALLQNVDTSLSSISSTLASMRALAVSAASESDATTRATYQTAFDNYLDDISGVVSRTLWNGNSVLDGTVSSATLQTGIYSGESKTLSFFDSSTSSLGISALDLSTSTTTATAAISALDSAISLTGARQTQIGSYMNSMTTWTDWNDSTSANLTTAYTNIMSADTAAETANLTAAQIKQTSASAMLAQANQMNKDLVTYLLRDFLN